MTVTNDSIIQSAIGFSTGAQSPTETHGKIEWYDSDGTVKQSWHIASQRCTLGSGADAQVQIPVAALDPIHLLIVFGRQFTLIKTISGKTNGANTASDRRRASKKPSKEWLIDQPTLIQCGDDSFRVWPTNQLEQNEFSSHEVTPGSLADQVARLRMPTASELSTMSKSIAPSDIPSKEGDIESYSSDVQPFDTQSLSDSLLQRLSLQFAGSVDELSRNVDSKLEAALAPIRKQLSQSSRSDQSNAAVDDRASLSQDLLNHFESRLSQLSEECSAALSNSNQAIEEQVSRLSMVEQQLQFLVDQSSRAPETHDAQLQTPYSQSDAQAYSTYDDSSSNEETRSELPSWFREEESAEEAPAYETSDQFGGFESESPIGYDSLGSQSNLPSVNYYERTSNIESTSDEYADEYTDEYSGGTAEQGPEESSNDQFEDSVEAQSEEQFDQVSLSQQISTSNYSKSTAAQAIADEESIEDYMQRLLQRVKGEPSGGPISKKTNVAAKATESTSSKESTNTQTLSQAFSEVDQFDATRQIAEEPFVEPVKEKEYAPRQSAPERLEKMAALRELANSTARRAINNSTQQRLESGLIGKYAIAAIAFIGGTFLLILNGLRPNIPMVGTIAAYCVCLIWGYDAWLQSRRLIDVKRKNSKDEED